MKVEYFPPKDDAILQNEAPTDFIFLLWGRGSAGLEKWSRADAEGSVPLWEAMLGAHMNQLLGYCQITELRKLSGDIGLFACTAAEANNLGLLKEIVRHGGNVTNARKDGSTALQIAVCEGNIEIVKFLLDKGANVDKTDEHGQTPWDLAEKQGHEDIKGHFEQYRQKQPQQTIKILEPRHGVQFLGTLKSEPEILPAFQDTFPAPNNLSGKSRPRHRTRNFSNSLFGIITAVQAGESGVLSSLNKDTSWMATGNYAARVTISCPEYGDLAGRLVLLPKTFQELHKIGAKKYGFFPSKVLTKDGHVIDDIVLIRYGDHLVFPSENGIKSTIIKSYENLK